MSGERTLYLARHGQAGGERYNELTETGRAQARALGRHLAERGLRFDAGATGALPRQQETYSVIAEELDRAGLAPPEPVEIVGLNEVDGSLWYSIGEELRRRDEKFRDDFQNWIGSLRKDPGARRDRYLPILERVLGVWIAGEYERRDVEPFETFHTRVLAAGDQAAATGANILCVSSGTPIALLLGRALGLDLAGALELLRVIPNTSLSVFSVDGAMWRPESVNQTPHLAAKETITII